MLSNFEIEDLAKRMSIPVAGIYSKDRLPKVLQERKAYIVNIEDSHDEDGNGLPGSHWTAFIVLPQSDKLYCFYFDSFGFGEPAELTKIVKSSKRIDRIVASRKQIQDDEVSAMCGWFCLAWLHFMLKDGDGKFFNTDLFNRYNDFLSLFEKNDLAANDEILKRFFQAKPVSRVE